MNHSISRWCAGFFSVTALMLLLATGSLSAATFTVTTTSDAGAGSLRQAILDANALVGSDIVAFNIAGAGVHTIVPASALPTVTQPVVIDGYTQPGASTNTLAVGNDAVLLIELDGTSAGSDSSGLILAGGDSNVRGLIINRFSAGFTGGGISVLSNNNVIEGNFIGLDPTGTAELGNSTGVRVASGLGNRVGGTTPAARNIISGNGFTQPTLGNVCVDKVLFSADPPPSGTLIRGNYIGTDATGMIAAHPQDFGSNTGVAVLVSAGTIIGGEDADDGALDGNFGARNLISGNTYGIYTTESCCTSGADITIKGNFIGVNASGNSALGNYHGGVFLSPQRGIAANRIVIGGTAAGAGNVISGNIDFGVYVVNSNVVMQGNRIGTDLSGTFAIGNLNSGAQLTYAGSPPFPSYQFTVGGATPAARNIISGNGGVYAIRINTAPSGSTTLQGNYIGTQGDGHSPLGNAGDGILLQQAGTATALGGAGIGEGNVIAFNGSMGVRVDSGPSAILGNSLFGNGSLGIDIFGNGVSPNDPGDADTGPNNVQNFPVLTSAASAGGTTVIQGTLNSAPGNVFRIEFFANATCDPAGNGEGQTLIGTATVTTNVGGDASFGPLTFATPAGQTVITSTATDAAGNTSEFSQCLSASGGLVATTTTVVSSLNPSTFGQAVTFTATVTGASPTGSVQFNDGAVPLATVALSGSTASFTTASLATGTHPITAVYGGDDSNDVSTSPILNQVVNGAGPVATSTGLVSSLNPSTVGQSVTFTATVTGASPGGTVQFNDGATLLATATLSGNVASFSTAALVTGTHPITAVYGGDANNSASTSPVLNQVVNAPTATATSTSLASSLNPSTFGQSVTFTASVTGASPGGSVQFRDGATLLATATLSASVASFTTSTLAPGSHPLTASYGGDAANAPSTSPVLTQIVIAGAGGSPAVPLPALSPGLLLVLLSVLAAAAVRRLARIAP